MDAPPLSSKDLPMYASVQGGNHRIDANEPLVHGHLEPSIHILIDKGHNFLELSALYMRRFLS